MAISTGAALGIQAGANFFDTIFGNRARKRAVDDARRYNHPKEQMKRLQEAGLNPNLIYGEGIKGATGGLADPVETEAPKIEPLAKMLAHQEVRQAKITNDILTEERRGKMLDNNMKNSQLFREGIINASFGTEFQHSREMKEHQRRKAAAEAGISEQQLNTVMATGDAQVQKIINDAMRSRHQMNNEQKLGVLRDLEAQLKEAQIEFYDANQIVSIITRILGVR